jgi:molybdenum cofactor cytidylyltransferase
MLIEAFILAAGTSSRMGSVNKLIKKMNRIPLIEKTITNYLNSNIDKVSIITGYEDYKINKIAEKHSIKTYYNRKYKTGILSSINLAVKKVNNKSSGIILGLGDMPLVSKKDLNPLIDNYKKERCRKIFVPICYGREGNPIIFPTNVIKKIISKVKSEEKDKGLKGLIKRYNYKTIKSSKAVLKDFDKISDFI